MRWAQYLIAVVVFLHGFIYVRVGGALPGSIPAWNGTSWILGATAAGKPLQSVIVTLHVVAGLLTIGAAVAMAFPASFPGWWRPLAIAGGVVGIAAFALFWDGRTDRLFDEGAIGALASVVLIVGAVMFPQAFNPAR